jgi:hypothetical protein
VEENGIKPLTIDWKKVDSYLQAQCDGKSIAGILGMHPNTFYRHCEEEKGMSFGDYSTQKKAEGKEILRAKQFQVAMAGDKTMLVWLGKQYLDQKDIIHRTGDGDIERIQIQLNTMASEIKVPEITDVINGGDDKVNDNQTSDNIGAINEAKT